MRTYELCNNAIQLGLAALLEVLFPSCLQVISSILSGVFVSPHVDQALSLSKNGKHCLAQSVHLLFEMTLMHCLFSCYWVQNGMTQPVKRSFHKLNIAQPFDICTSRVGALRPILRLVICGGEPGLTFQADKLFFLWPLGPWYIGLSS